MTRPTCRCGKPVNGTTLCTGNKKTGDKGCQRTLEIALANTITYFDDLDTVRNRQTRYGGMATKGSIGKTRPVGMDLAFDTDGAATRAYTATRETVRKWGRTAMLEWPAPMAGPACRIAVDKRGNVQECRHKSCADIRARAHPNDTVRSVLRYLARNLKLITVATWGQGFMTDILACERALARVVDRPAEGWYAGICGHTIEEERKHDGTSCGCNCHVGLDVPCDLPGGCGLEFTTIPGVTCAKILYAQPDKPHVTCRDCGTRHQVKDRREQLVKEAEDRFATVRILARIITTLGASDASEARLEGRINLWVHRGKLRAGGERVVSGRPSPVYRVGDVLDLLAQDAATRSA